LSERDDWTGWVGPSGWRQGCCRPGCARVRLRL